MQKDLKVDENLIEQNVNDFINEVLQPHPLLKFTKFSFAFDRYSFYLKAEDLLQPNTYVNKKTGMYCFNKYTFLSTSVINIHTKSLLSKEALFEYLESLLEKSKEYQQYLKRLNNEI